MNKEQLLKAIGTYEGDLEDVLELLEILNGERCNNDNHNDTLTWSAIKGTAKGFKNPQYKYVEVWTATNGLSAMITDAINEAKKEGFRWHDTQYTMGNNQGVLIHSALLIFKKD